MVEDTGSSGEHVYLHVVRTFQTLLEEFYLFSMDVTVGRLVHVDMC